MCLYATTKEALIAEEDIKVIKAVRVKRGKYYSPYQQSLLEDKCLNINVITHTSIIYGEGIHACTNIETAMHHKNHLERNFMHDKFILINGVIPKGTYYWKDGDGEIAAKHIKFDRSGETNWFNKLIHKWKAFLKK